MKKRCYLWLLLLLMFSAVCVADHSEAAVSIGEVTFDTAQPAVGEPSEKNKTEAAPAIKNYPKTGMLESVTFSVIGLLLFLTALCFMRRQRE